MTRIPSLPLLVIILTASLAIPPHSATASEPVVVALWTDAQLNSTAADDTEVTQNRENDNAWVTGINRPTLTVYAAEPEKSLKTGIVICPGGGYGGLAIEKEGHEVARWFAAQGVTAGVLTYRCGGGPNQHPVPMQDAARAVELFRQHTDQWNVAADRIGILGFSAGGHLASTIATDPETAVNFAVLVYPVITMAADVTHGGSKNNLLGKSPDAQLVKQMSRDEQVTEKTCPTFLVHAGDDKAVPVENSLRFYAACVAHGVPAEMHLYPAGGHGFGMYRGDRSVDQWPDLMKIWMVANGWCR